MDILPDIASRSGVERVRAMLISGALVDARDKDGRTTLFKVARLGKVEHVKLLLEFGGNPNAVDNHGEAPLQAAARYDHLECVELLIKSGAQVDYCPEPKLTECSESALCSAVRKGHERVAESLLRAGASPNAATSAGRLPLLEAAANGDTSMCRRLVEAGACINQGDKHGATALHYAVRSQSVETVRALLDMGANVNAGDDEGTTPVLEAISPILEQGVPLLFAFLKAKPDLSIRGRRRGYTPLEQAMVFELDEVADLLRTAGAKKSAAKSASSDAEFKVFPGGTGDGADVGVSFSLWEAPVEAKDRAFAEDLSKSKIPALLKNFGWEASPRHWLILENTIQPIPLTRIAYFARGFFNRPSGKELQDGPEMLGESYREAVDRFVSLGFLQTLESTELVKLLATTSELKAVAKMRGIKLPSKRAEMLEIVLANANPEDFPEIIKRGPYYVNTPKGRDAVQNRGDWRVRVERRLRNEIVEALLERNLKWAFMLSQEIDSLNRHWRNVLPETVCRARLVIENPIPESFRYAKNEEAVLRAVAAASQIVTGGDDWSLWRTVRVPTIDSGESLTPSDFAFSVMCNGETEAWEDSAGE
jgi:ankyrin repeat protein